MKRILHLFFLLLASGTLHSQVILISDFENLSAQALSFNGAWNGGEPFTDQFVQETDFISITSVNGGDPKGDGTLYANLDGVVPLDFTGMTHLSLVAKVDAGNQVEKLVVEVRDSTFTVIGTSTFFTTSYNSSFSAQSAVFVLGDGVLSDAAYWVLYGDSIGGNSIRMSFDELVAIPEPSTVCLAVVSLVGLAIARRRRS